MSTPGRMKKTKQAFIDAARQVFAKLGVTGATMNDIAEASKKGRRTLYLYFNNKEELYYALVEQEMGIVVNQLAEVAAKKLPAGDKLIEYIYMHLDCMRDLVQRNGTLRADFFNDIKTIESLRRPIDLKEIKIIKGILQQGVDSGEFDIPDVDTAASIVLYSLKGLEGPYNRQKMAARMAKHREEIARLLTRSFRKDSYVPPKDDPDIPEIPENLSSVVRP